MHRGVDQVDRMVRGHGQHAALVGVFFQQALDQSDAVYIE